MSTKTETDYEKYIRTGTLLSLQIAPEDLSCHDELTFQMVHQAAEIWMKLALHEIAHAAQRIDADEYEQARSTLYRIRVLVNLLADQFRVLETMSPKAYFTVRAQLGNGSGQESPGFNALLEAPAAVREALGRLLKRHSIELITMHRDPEDHPRLFTLTEAMLDFDAAFQHFRYQHLALVRRIIGGRTPSLKGIPAEMLENGIKQSLFPELWLVREALYRDYTPNSEYGESKCPHAH